MAVDLVDEHAARAARTYAAAADHYLLPALRFWDRFGAATAARLLLLDAFAAEMWRLVRPGGRLAITTWGPGLFEPANGLFWRSVRELSPSLYKSFRPWDQITTPRRLARLFNRADIEEAQIDAVRGEHRLNVPEDFWHIVLGSGCRATVDALDPEHRATLRSTLLGRLRDRGVATLRTDVVYGVALRR